MDGWKVKLLGFAGAAALAFVASCDNGPSAVETRERSAEAPTAYERADYEVSERPARGDRRDAPRAANDDAPRFDGKPLWSSNRKYSAAENADYHFRRNGKDFGARDVDAYVARAHAFIRNPPPGTLTFRRRNGDRLMYDPAGNVFAVATKAGAPRTMFKPEDGMAYWRRTTAAEERRAARRTRASREGERDEG